MGKMRGGNIFHMEKATSQGQENKKNVANSATVLVHN